jgi:hypothetical protein
MKFAVALFVAAAAVRLEAQTEVRTATPQDLGTVQEERAQVEDPMVIEISLGGDEARKPLNDLGVTGRTYYDQKKFEVDKAWVPKVTVMKRKGKRGGLVLEVAPTIKTGWFRQDIDVTVAILQGTKEVRRIVWDDITVGRDDSWGNKLGMVAAAGSANKKALFEFKDGEFEGLFSSEAPKLRLILDIQGGEEE